jgi:hypothetical protein
MKNSGYTELVKSKVESIIKSHAIPESTTVWLLFVNNRAYAVHDLTDEEVLLDRSGDQQVISENMEPLGNFIAHKRNCVDLTSTKKFITHQSCIFQRIQILRSGL